MLPAAQWQPDTGVIGRLLAAPSRMDFFQALRLLLASLRAHGVDAEQAFECYLRLHGSTALTFAPAQIEQLWLEHNDELVVHVRAAMIGFLGVQGTLPLHDTVTLLRHARQRGDAGLPAWLDCLSQRALAQFYQAWARYRIECHGPDGGEFLQLQLALAGTSAARLLRDAGQLPAHAVAHYAALLRRRPVSAGVMQAVLAEYFGIKVQLQRFVATWISRPPREQSRLVGSMAPLGGGAMLGERCRRADLRVGLTLGPLSRAEYDDFLPGRSGALALRQMLALFGLPSLSFAVRLLLRRDAIHGCTLDLGACLGRDAYLLAAPPLTDRADLHYLVRFDGSA